MCNLFLAYNPEYLDVNIKYKIKGSIYTWNNLIIS